MDLNKNEKKNLLIVCVGKTSLHKNWIGAERNFDIMLVHYGDDDSYNGEGEYYIREKGSKFNIISKISDKIPCEYDYIFIPDDDLYLDTKNINKLFEISKQYSLKICQPSLMGYFSVYINLHHPGNILRYTNFVETIAPCFSREAFEHCRHTFNYNKSGWGIDVLWDKILGFPKNKIAVIDDVIAIHTRPCFSGDHYTNNNLIKPDHELNLLLLEQNLNLDKKVYGKEKLKNNSTDIMSYSKYFLNRSNVKFFV